MSHIFRVTHIFWSAGCSTVSALCSPRSAPLHRVNINNSGAEKAIFISCSLPFSLRTFRQSLLMGDGVAQTHRLVLSVLFASEADLQVKAGDIFQTRDKSFLANGNVCVSLSPLFILFISHTFLLLAPQVSSVLVISRQRGTMASWTRSKPCAGSTRTLATLAETPRGSPSSAPEPGPPASTCSSSRTTRKVIEGSVVCFLDISCFILVYRLHSAQALSIHSGHGTRVIRLAFIYCIVAASISSRYDSVSVSPFTNA